MGYKAAGWSGATVATAAIFSPAFVLAVVVARFIRAARQWDIARAFLKGVGAAVVGAILAVAISLGRAAVVDVLTGLLAAVALVALVRYRVEVTYLLAGGATVGFLAQGAL